MDGARAQKGFVKKEGIEVPKAEKLIQSEGSSSEGGSVIPAVAPDKRMGQLANKVPGRARSPPGIKQFRFC